MIADEYEYQWRWAPFGRLVRWRCLVLLSTICVPAFVRSSVVTHTHTDTFCVSFWHCQCEKGNTFNSACCFLVCGALTVVCWIYLMSFNKCNPHSNRLDTYANIHNTQQTAGNIIWVRQAVKSIVLSVASALLFIDTLYVFAALCSIIFCVKIAKMASSLTTFLCHYLRPHTKSESLNRILLDSWHKFSANENDLNFKNNVNLSNCFIQTICGRMRGMAVLNKVELSIWEPNGKRGPRIPMISFKNCLIKVQNRAFAGPFGDGPQKSIQKILFHLNKWPWWR